MPEDRALIGTGHSIRSLSFDWSKVGQHMRFGSKDMVAIEADVIQHRCVRPVTHECFIPIRENPHRPPPGDGTAPQRADIGLSAEERYHRPGAVCAGSLELG